MFMFIFQIVFHDLKAFVCYIVKHLGPLRSVCHFTGTIEIIYHHIFTMTIFFSLSTPSSFVPGRPRLITVERNR